MSQSPKHLRAWRVAMISVAVVAAVAGVYFLYTRFWASDKTTSNSTQVVAVRIGNISQTLTLSGTLAYFETNSLTFNATGTVQEVAVAAGASVTKGQLLARLDAASSRTLQTAVLNAQVALDTAQVNLNNANRPDTNPQINTAKVAITNAQIALNTSQTNLYNAQHPYTDLDIANAQAAVTSARIAINTTGESLYKVQHPYTDEQITTAQTTVNTTKTTITTAQQDLSYVQEKNRIDFTVAWYVVSNATIAYQNATATYGPMSGYSVNASNSLATAQNNLNIVLAANAKALKAAEDKVSLAQDTLALAQNTVGNMTALPDPLIVQQKQEQLLIAQLNLVKTQDSLAKMQTGPGILDVQLKQEQLVVAQNNLAVAQDNLTKMNAGPDPWDIQLKQQQLTVAQNNLANAQQTLADQQKALNTTLRQLAVDNAQAALDQAKIAAQSTNLTAPISGIVTSVGIRAGQAVNANTPAIDLSVPAIFGMTALVNQLDISRLRLDQAAVIKTDAIAGVILNGRISSINSTPVTQQGVVSYRVTVMVPAQPGSQLLKAGMTGTSNIIVQQANNVLLVPIKAVGGTLSNPTVIVMTNNQTQTLSVKTGINDGAYTEITAGLQAGDIVVIPNAVKATSSKTTTTNATANTTSTSNRTTTTNSTSIPTDRPITPGGGQFPPGGGANGGGFQIPTGGGAAGGGGRGGN